MVWVIGEDAPIGAFLMAEAPYLGPPENGQMGCTAVDLSDYHSWCPSLP